MHRFYLFLSLLFGLALSAQDHRVENSAFLKSEVTRCLSANKLDSALWHTERLIIHHHEDEDPKEYVRAHTFKAEILRSLGDLELALAALEKVEGLNEGMEMHTVKSVFYNRKAAILFELKKPKESLEAVKQSQFIDSVQGFTWRILSNYNIEASIYRDLGDFKKAIPVYRKSLAVYKQNADTAEAYRTLHNLALAFFRTSQYDSTLNYALQYPKIKSYSKVFDRMLDNYRLIAETFFQKGEFQKAYQYLDTATEINLKQSKEILDDRVDAYRVRNELQIKQLENSVLAEQNEKSQFRTIALIFALISLSLLAFFIFKQKENYKSLHQKQDELNQEMADHLRFKNRLVSILAHDIRNPLNSSLGLLQLFHEKAISKEELIDLSHQLRDSTESVSLLLDNILSWVGQQEGEFQANLASFDVAPLLQDLEGQLLHQMKQKSQVLKIENQLKESSIVSDQNMVNLILRNLLTNAIKFSPAGSEIMLVCHEKEDSYCFEVVDQGPGMNAEKLQELQQGKAISKMGTENEKGSGLGLSLSREFVNLLEGKMTFYSKEGEGTRVELCLPK